MQPVALRCRRRRRCRRAAGRCAARAGQPAGDVLLVCLRRRRRGRPASTGCTPGVVVPVADPRSTTVGPSTAASSSIRQRQAYCPAPRSTSTSAIVPGPMRLDVGEDRMRPRIDELGLAGPAVGVVQPDVLSAGGRVGPAGAAGRDRHRHRAGLSGVLAGAAGNDKTPQPGRGAGCAFAPMLGAGSARIGRFQPEFIGGSRRFPLAGKLEA